MNSYYGSLLVICSTPRLCFYHQYLQLNVKIKGRVHLMQTFVQSNFTLMIIESMQKKMLAKQNYIFSLKYQHNAMDFILLSNILPQQ